MANKKLLGILLLGVVFAGIVSAQDMMDWTITIVNNTSRVCTSLYVNDDNVIAGKTIPSKGSLTIKMIAPDFSYMISSGYNNISLGVSSGDSGSYIKEGVNVQPGMKIVFTDSDTFKSNKGPAVTIGGSQGRAIPQKSSDERNITIRNDLYEDIARVYVRAAGSTRWGDEICDRINSRSSGAKIRIPLSLAQNFDLKAVTAKGAELVLSNLKAGSDNAQFTFK